MRSRSAPTASSSSRRCPCLETKTGSTTRLAIRVSATTSATASTIAADASIPVLAASTPMSVDDRADLLGDDLRREGLVADHAPGVLDRDGRDRRHPVHAERAERLQVRLDARAAARVGAGDRERPRARRPNVVVHATRLPVGEVIPARGFERRRPAVGVHGHEAGTRDDLADLGQVDAEPRAQLLARALDRVRRQGREQLVVLAAESASAEASTPSIAAPLDSGSATGTAARTTRAPTPLASHRRERSFARPSERSIIAVAPARASICPSPTRATGRSSASISARPQGCESASAARPAAARESASPPAAAPSDPVTTIRSPDASARAQHRAAGCDLAHHGHRDDDELGPVRVAPDQREGVLVAGIAHPADQLHHPGRIDVVRQRERDERVRGGSPPSPRRRRRSP